MNIRCTEQARIEINKKMDVSEAKLKLVHTVEGCGCVNSGVAQLWMVDHAGEYDFTSTAGTIPILYDSRYEVFYEDEIQIDYLPHKKTFVLKSKHQIYNPAMQLLDRRG